MTNQERIALHLGLRPQDGAIGSVANWTGDESFETLGHVYHKN